MSKQTPQQLQKWLTYIRFISSANQKVVTHPIQNQGQDADIQVNVGLGVINIPFAFKLHFNHPNTTENNFMPMVTCVLLKGQMGFRA